MYEGLRLAGALGIHMRPTFAALLVPLIFLAAVAPAAHAATGRDWSFSDAANAQVEGAFTLVSGAASSAVVELPAGVPVTWADEVPLSAPAAFQDGAFSFDVYLTKAAGTLTLRFGYVLAGEFVALDALTVDVAMAPRSLVSGLPVASDGTGTDLDIGRAQGSKEAASGTYPAGSFPALQVESDVGNGLYTGPTTFGASDASGATVPLPELPALILFAGGLAVVGAVAFVRARK